MYTLSARLQPNILRFSIRSGTKLGPSSARSKQTLPAIVEVKATLEKQFPEYFSNGKFVNRISYVDFIDQALDKFDELGLSRNLEAYKELLRVFPPGKYHPTPGFFEGTTHNVPQQEAARRIIFKLQTNRLYPDAELESIVIRSFSKKSEVWNLVARGLYWTSKFRNVDTNPLPDVLPKEPHELAKIGIQRMLKDQESMISVSNTSILPDSIDKTWIVHAQSSVQQKIIEDLDEKAMVCIENAGLTYVFDKFLSYYALKVYDSEETIEKRAKEPKRDYNYNTVKMSFYGKPIHEKLSERANAHHVGDGHILAIGMTGTSSHDSILSWLKILEKKNPRLQKLNVLFKIERPTMELINTDQERLSKGTEKIVNDSKS